MFVVTSDRDQALEELSSEFVAIPARITVHVFLSYLRVLHNVAAAKSATRARIRDACTAA